MMTIFLLFALAMIIFMVFILPEIKKTYFPKKGVDFSDLKASLKDATIGYPIVKQREPIKGFFDYKAFLSFLATNDWEFEEINPFFSSKGLAS